MSTIKTTIAAGVTVAFAGLSFAAVPADAAALPSCATSTHCADNSSGEAGYYGADDSHTHYRFVQTTVKATPQLVNLNGAGGTAYGQGFSYQFASDTYAHSPAGNFVITGIPQSHSDSSQSLGADGADLTTAPGSSGYADSGVIVNLGTLDSMFSGAVYHEPVITGSPNLEVNFYFGTNGSSTDYATINGSDVWTGADGNNYASMGPASGALDSADFGTFSGEPGTDTAFTQLGSHTLTMSAVQADYASESGHENVRTADPEVWAWIGISGATAQTAHVTSVDGKNLAGPGYTSSVGAVGAELCDPNTGAVAQVGLWYGTDSSGVTGYHVSYATGTFSLPAKDPCIQDGFANPVVASAQQLLSNFTINQGDSLYLGAYYDPSGRHFHQLSFGVCDITLDVCRQAWDDHSPAQDFYEFGIGAISNAATLTGGAVNFLDTFSGSDVTCYSCAGPVAISKVSPVNSFGAGGLYEAQWVNTSSQVEMSPNDSLSGDAFSLYEGSTSP